MENIWSGDVNSKNTWSGGVNGENIWSGGVNRKNTSAGATDVLRTKQLKQIGCLRCMKKVS